MIAAKKQELAEVESAARTAAMFGMPAHAAALNLRARSLRAQIGKASRTEVECLVKGVTR